MYVKTLSRKPRSQTPARLDIGIGPCALPRLFGQAFRKPYMHAYRTHTCGALRLADKGENVRLSGWIHRKRDHGGLLFIDLRDHYGRGIL